MKSNQALCSSIIQTWWLGTISFPFWGRPPPPPLLFSGANLAERWNKKIPSHHPIRTGGFWHPGGQGSITSSCWDAESPSKVKGFPVGFPLNRFFVASRSGFYKERRWSKSGWWMKFFLLGCWILFEWIWWKCSMEKVLLDVETHVLLMFFVALNPYQIEMVRGFGVERERWSNDWLYSHK